MNTARLTEWKKVALAFVAMFLISRVLFFNADLAVLAKSTFTAFWVLVVPGIGLTYLLDNLSFIERFSASIIISAALIGTASYYLGLLGMHINYSIYVLPPFFALLSALVLRTKSKKD